MSITSSEIRRIVPPLRIIFWGGLICVFDFKINGFDLVNDLVGMIMITWGVFQVSKINVHDRYSKAMLFVKIVAILECINVLHGQFAYRPPKLFSIIFSLIGVAAMLAIVVFCVAMRWLSSEAKLEASAGSWKTTALLFTVIYLIPLGLFYFAAAVAIATGKSFNINLGPAGLLLLPVFLLPLIHLFISTSRTKTEAQMSTDTCQQNDALDEYSTALHSDR
jgi:hypothetical protein